jgi:enamine deaminase RidA (YjgF/YER057c/UK114 family)
MSTAPQAANRPPLSRFRVHGNTVYVSGQVPIRDGAVVSEDFAAQAKLTL